ncbi:similarity to D-ribose transport binding protein [Encephalitozoon cuniculi GB-M1]|uniref:Similarity to D-ribose transport binding protein n=2 Tax=Encephalitozoon cuniculi TaxID=6035 RepID=Q8SUP4_ENCCU|nr:uncharacterized protein ECU08_1050 [Encephalitozoon cuniculi GB-M1]AGE95122.1 d-ribose transport binding protein [Encephalitozoon cuniculi]KMV65634.1 hypothetical protein M970_081090 [Encephalitozoon cuniculi EcunIII-L]UYI27036.1 hypothetical protein J0A71_04g08860 [Encephalitozoon cuniculi]CAD26411.1 similarity to D-ribose transport binding protein [Encephalitozoon cuniculi GB-M1]
MYEELLNFLLARKKKLLSEEETDRLMQLIAQSMEMGENQEEKKDNTALIKKILDNVDVDQIVEDDTESMENAIDDLLFNEYSDESCSEGMMDLYESDDAGEPLSERKFRRGVFKTRTEPDGSLEIPKRTIGIKASTRRGAGALDLDAGDEKSRAHEAGNGSPERSKDALEVREFKLPGFDVKDEGLLYDKGSKKGFDLPEASEFQFDLGDLKEVNNTGPDVKFFDEDGKEL